ncbi:MAG: hypothetical protein DRP71_00040 [Verrucomicrobia bacterium]|nr:MAG: hypothetical protein DRP71_00040 [Verrucomicrobiota bacterium]
MKSFTWFVFFLSLPVQGLNSLSASEMDLILQKHLDAVGGASAIARLNSIRSSGVVLISSQRVPFEFWAAFPNKLRIESSIGERIHVQCYDGVNPPWQWFPETIYSIPEELADEVAVEFISDSDFNGPLINHQGKGHELTLEGKTSNDAREVYRIALIEKTGLKSTILVDAETYLIVRRSGVRRGGGTAIELDTYYLDYRNVAGVLLPHRYEIYRGTTLVRTTLIQSLEGNVRIPPAVFRLPDGPDPVRARIEAEHAQSERTIPMVAP